jgi:hypothetical protein
VPVDYQWESGLWDISQQCLLNTSVEMTVLFLWIRFARLNISGWHDSDLVGFS